MKAKYPNMSDDEIQQNLATMYDESGNYRSDLYQKYMTGSNLGANQGNVDTANIVYDQYGNPIVKPVKPSDTGVLDINAAREQYQTLNTPLANLKADDEARRALGSTPPTSGAASGTSAGTQFNTIKPSGSATKPPASNPAPTLDKPIIVPSSMTSNGNPTSGQKAPDDPTNKYNTSTGQLNPNYKAPASATPTTGSKPKYTGSSIVDYLNSSGQASDYASRAAQAAKLGITGYTGSAAQNTQMLQMLNK